MSKARDLANSANYAVNAQFNVKNNFAATVAPTVNEDSSAGWSVGSRIVDAVTDLAYTCVDATVGAAVWTQGGSGAAGGYDTYSLEYSVAIQWDVIHNLDADQLEIEVIDHAGNMVTPTSTKHFDKNRVIVNFSKPVTGTVVCKSIPVVNTSFADAKLSDWMTTKFNTRNTLSIKPSLEVAAGFRVDDGAGVTYPNANITQRGIQDQPQHVALADDKFITATVTLYSDLTYGTQERLTLYINQFNRTTGKIDTLSYWIPANAAYGTGTGYNAEEDSVYIKLINATTLLVCSYEQSEADAGATVLIARTFDLTGDTLSLIGEAIAVNGVYGTLTDGREENVSILAVFGTNGAMVTDRNGLIPIVFDGILAPYFTTQVPYDATLSGGTYDDGGFSLVDLFATASLNATQAVIGVRSGQYAELRVVNWNAGALTFGPATVLPSALSERYKLTEAGVDRVIINTDGISGMDVDHYLSLIHI